MHESEGGVAKSLLSEILQSAHDMCPGHVQHRPASQAATHVPTTRLDISLASGHQTHRHQW